MDKLTLKVLGMFDDWNKETLDLHELFEAGGNDPDERKSVFYTGERWSKKGVCKKRQRFLCVDGGGKRVARENPESPKE